MVVFFTNATTGITNNYSNETTEENTSTFEPIFYSVLNATLALVGICGNTLVIVSMMCFSHLRSTHHLYLLSLAAVDILMCLVVYPLYIVNTALTYWPFGHILCRVWYILDLSFSTISCWNLVAIASNRYYAIADPLHYTYRQRRKRVLLTILAVWLLPPSVTTLLAMLWMNSFNPTENIYSGQGGFDVCEFDVDSDFTFGGFLIVLVLFLGPLFFLIIAYGKIYRIAKKHIESHAKRTYLDVVDDFACKDHKCKVHRNNHGNKPVNSESKDSEETTKSTVLLSAQNSADKTSEKQERTHHSQTNIFHTDLNSRTKNRINKIQCICERKERKLFCMTVTVVSLFAICWLPIMLFMTVATIDCIKGSCQVLHSSPHLHYIVQLMAYGNSVINPIVYTIFSAEFRRAFKAIITFSPCKKQFGRYSPSTN